ncbi:deoxyguanosinetriphosphate triphosphohydrolase [Caviibacter abscessus]|uniref:deoxyguanosinetriphosphate triphosphohydrolase n=1 Tax=Caviibacter abscessus TaxID=1766719 RepID=UPI000A8315BB|nr:deoxyguanosinetriphosphate triphosphohydrolase [Caviibacter abscessus]
MRMNWKDLLSTESQRTRSSVKASDIRDDFEKDFHRIVSSPSFRRLQDKTQAFPLEENDFVRTRLTHSIEVSSFAKALATSIGNRIIGEKLDEDFGYNELNFIVSILSSAALMHDMGNPPFGHFGEDSIRSWFKNNVSKIEVIDFYGNKVKLNKLLNEQMLQDFYNFEGNAQTLRIVSKLHFIVDEYGMNLTYGLLNTIIKYPISSLEIDKSKNDSRYKKMGYYFAEKELFGKIVSSTKCYNKKNPLTYLLEAADDIAYATADIEDGFKKKHISFQNFEEKLAEFGFKKGNVYYDRFYKYYEDANKKDVYDKKEYAVQRWIISIQGLIINDVVNTFIDNYEKIMNGELEQDLFYYAPCNNLVKMLKNMAKVYVFDSKIISKTEISANTIIHSLLDSFIPAIVNYDTLYDTNDSLFKRYRIILSDSHQYIYKIYAKKYENENKNRVEEENIYNYKLYLRLLLVTDFISGMTDNYSKTLYQELKSIK